MDMLFASTSSLTFKMTMQLMGSYNLRALFSQACNCFRKMNIPTTCKKMHINYQNLIANKQL